MTQPNPFKSVDADQDQPTAASYEPPTGTLREAAAKRLQQLTAPGSALDRRRRELVDSLNGDWRHAAPWIKTLAYLIAAAAGFLLLATVGGILLNAVTDLVNGIHLPADWAATDTGGLAQTITDPVHRFLDARTATLPVTGTTAYTLWKTAGLAAGLLAFASRATTARLAWSAWSASTLAVVWTATDPAGRPVAAGITATAIAAASLLALRGISFSLRPVLHTSTRTDVAPVIHVTIPAQPGPADGATLAGQAGHR
ncbi:hypothetical protein [Kitasatospora sp. NPDC057223]|uniref:hypothetical protein n=1 Tax=Kitasatospora sp. NPDC057223 TaxID=3346055 RepID=UPI003638C45E